MVFNYCLNKHLSFTETSIAYSVSEDSFLLVEIYKDHIHKKGYKLYIYYMLGFHYNDNNDN